MAPPAETDSRDTEGVTDSLAAICARNAAASKLEADDERDVDMLMATGNKQIVERDKF